MTNQAVEWYLSLDNDIEFLTEEAKAGFAVCLERSLHQNDMSKTDLARRLEKSQAYVTKILRGDSNLTIKTMVELADAVDSSLHLHIAPRQAAVRWLEVFKGSVEADVTVEERSAAIVWARQASKGTRGYFPSAA